MTIERRTFITGAIGTLTLLGVPAGTFLLQAKDRDFIAGLGVIPPGRLPFKGQETYGSALTVFDSASAASSTHIIPVRGAHEITRLPDGDFAVISNVDQLAILDDKFQTRKVVTAAVGWEFGGHGIWLADKGMLLVGLRPARTSKERSHGKMILLNRETGKTEAEIDSHGFDPHDLRRLPGGDIAICNYGHRNANDLINYENLEPNIVIFDGNTLAQKDIIAGPAIGSLSHFCEGPGNTIAAIPARLNELNQDNLDQVSRAARMEQGIDITAAEIAEGKVGFPSPVLTFDRGEKSWKSFLQQPAKQRRPQSIVYHRQAGAWFVTYPFSEQIVRVRTDGSMDFLPAFDLGISYPRGLCIGAGGDVYVSGQYRGLARFNPVSLREAGRWDLPMHDGTHIYSLG
jgi:hypothetical protein